MILKPEPLFAAVEALRTPDARVILMDPRGRLFTQAVAEELGGALHLVLLCGRYEGVDERVSERVADEALSIGDYVLTGGELPALVVTDAVVRLLPGVLGGEGAAERESFAGGLLEPPQYTRPEEFRGQRVPPVLLSGDHARVARWRRTQALYRTWRTRPDLLKGRRPAPRVEKRGGRSSGGSRPSSGRGKGRRHGCDSADRSRAAQEGPQRFRPRRHRARAREGHRGREGAAPGVRGRRHSQAGGGRSRLLHRAPHLLRRG